tara:strand:+ start:109 stop:1629 length:1521 start_codon:yes stop_codon:yes gene_type:complete
LKKFKEVEATRKKYHKDPTSNSVHRSSLMVPELDNCVAEISFLNHFLIKRNHKKIACVVTAIDKDGKKIESKLHHVDEPKVYTLTLTGMVNQPVSNYMVEFFSVDNLFIPFPAVMINHRNDRFLNQVHSYNRVLNDIFENDEINSNPVKESSIDLIINKNTDTCLLFTAGPMNCKGKLEIEIANSKTTYRTNQQLDVPRFCSKKISLRETFKDLPDNISGIIKAKQPEQLLFYGRLLSGQWIYNDGVFSANHSYYDSSSTEEYWNDDRPSEKQFPFFSELINKIKIYPIASPSELEVLIYVNSSDGKQILKEKSIDFLKSPSNEFVDINVNSIIEESNLDEKDISSYGVKVNTINSSRMPTRIGHQLVLSGGGLDSSINVVLNNPNKFIPMGRKSLKWGQIVTGGGFDSFVGLTADSKENPEILHHDVDLVFYNETGKIKEKKVRITNGSSVKFSAEQELQDVVNFDKIKKPSYVWCTAESDKHGLNFYSCARNKTTKHCSGDHGF